MKNKLFDFLLHKLLPIAFWLSVWEIAAIIVNRSYFLPHVGETFVSLCNVIFSPEFPKVVSLTILRVLLGIAFGTIFGFVFAIISHNVKIVYSLISPINSVIKATPVASIIILLWISMNGNALAVFIAFLMVFPIIWQNLYDAFSSIDTNLIEVSRVFQFSYKKRLKLLVLPALKRYFLPAFVTAIGLAFKAEIAAEIIVGVRDSIGQMIYHSKDALITADVFAWTIVGVGFSIIIESLARRVLLPQNARKTEAEI